MTIAALPNAVQNHVSARPSFPLGGTTRFCHAGDNLQTAINACSPGDTLIVDQNTDFGAVTLPARSDSGWIAIVSSGTLPAIGTRIAPADASRCFRITSPSGVAGNDGTQGWYIRGMHMAPTGNTGALIAFQGNPSAGGTHVSGETEVQRIILQHLLIDVPDSRNIRRGILANGRDIRLADSYLDGFHDGVFGAGSDSQAWLAYNCTGVHRLENNYLSAASENLMYGGADSQSATYIPSDIEIIRNTFRKNPRWDPSDPAFAGTVMVIKAGLEFKCAVRVLVEGNDISKCWLWAPFTLDWFNQDNTAPWSTLQDVMIRNNRVTGPTPKAFQVSSFLYPNAGAARLAFINNLVTGVAAISGDNTSGSAVHLGWNSPNNLATDVTFLHNTVLGCNRSTSFIENQTQGPIYIRITSKYNVWGFGDAGWHQERGDITGVTTTGEGDALLDAVMPDREFAQNAMLNMGTLSGGIMGPPQNTRSKWPQTEFINPDSSPAASGVNASTGVLDPTSPLKGIADNGSDVGVDFAALNAALLGEAVNASFTSVQTANTLTVVFTDQSTGAGLNSWTWDFGDGGTSNLQNPSHTFPSSGNFQVQLTASNGQQSTSTQTIHVVGSMLFTALAMTWTGANLLVVGSTQRRSLISDNFNRANGALGASWVDYVAVNS